MNGYYEGDLIRPLGLVTLYFGYAEAEVNALIEMLSDSGLKVKVSSTAPFGLRISKVVSAIRTVNCDSAGEVLAILAEVEVLLEERNALIHGAVYSQGRVVPNDSRKSQFYVSPESLTELAEKAFNWKERLNAKIQRQFLPALRDI